MNGIFDCVVKYAISCVQLKGICIKKVSHNSREPIFKLLSGSDNFGVVNFL